MSNVLNVSKTACKVSVTCGSVPNVQIGKNCKRARFIYNSKMNPAYIEALMARKQKGYHTKANVNQVVYSSIFSANVNRACDTDPNVKPVCTSPAYMKQVSGDYVCHASVPV